MEKPTRLDWAKNYLSYGMRKGYIHQEYDLEEMEPGEIIKIADELEDEAQHNFDLWKENQ